MKNKTELLAELLPEGDDCAVITSEDNRNYFLGFAASNGTLVVGRDRAVFFTDSRYITAAQEQIKSAQVVLQEGPRYKMLGEIFKKNNYKKAAFEAAKITVAEFAQIRKNLPDSELDFSGEIDKIILNRLRRKKTPEEVKKIIKAQRIAEDCLNYILNKIDEGMTEKQIQLDMDFYMLSHGADALSFETIVVSGANSAKPHGVPGNKKIKQGEFITMDFGAVCGFYHSDMTRTVCLGKASAQMKEVYSVVLAAQTAGVKAAKDGVPCAEIDDAARKVIKDAGYGDFFGHSLGHGVGVEIHEQPCFAPLSTDVFESGDIVTVEPGIYIPGKFGVRIEDMIYNDGGQTRFITNAPHELKEL